MFKNTPESLEEGCRTAVEEHVELDLRAVLKQSTLLKKGGGVRRSNNKMKYKVLKEEQRKHLHCQISH